jgi:hypothetical protein
MHGEQQKQHERDCGFHSLNLQPADKAARSLTISTIGALNRLVPFATRTGLLAGSHQRS